MALIRHLAALLLWVAFSGTSWADPELSFNLFSTDPLVPYAVKDGYKGSLMLEAKNLPGQSNLSPDVSDIGIGGPADMSVSVNAPVDAGEHDKSHFWVIELSFTKLPENETLLTRYLKITLNKKNYYHLPYKIQTQKASAKSAFSWELNAPPQEWLAENDTTAFSVKTGKVAATNIRVVHSTLQDEETKRLISPADLVLCLTPDKKTNKCVAVDNAPVVLKADHLQPVFLSLVKQPPPGSYKGTISIGADETDLAKSLQLNIHVSSVYWQWIGIGLIAFGLFVAWVVNVFVGSQRAQLEAMRPALMLVEDLDALEKRRHEFVTLTSFPLNEIQKAIKDLQGKLTKKFLRGDLPTPLTTAWPNKEKYEAHLKDIGNRAASLTLIIEEGVEKFQKEWATYDSNKKASKKVSAEQTLKTLDGFAIQLDENFETIRTKVKNAILEFKGHIGTMDAASPSEPTVQKIDINLLRLDYLTWFLWWVVSIVVGFAVLILNDPGFGTTLDLVKAFLWGIGAHVAGASLQSLTPGTVMTSFNVSFPGAKK